MRTTTIWNRANLLHAYVLNSGNNEEELQNLKNSTTELNEEKKRKNTKIKQAIISL
jgi:hypothetical protein